MLTNEVITKLIADNKQFDNAMRGSVRVTESFKTAGEKVTKTITEFAQTTDGSVRVLRQFNAKGQEVGQTMSVIAKQAEAATKASLGLHSSVGDIGNAVKGFISSGSAAGFSALGVAITGVGVAAKFAFDQLAEGAKKATLSKFFENSGKNLADYRDAVRGMVSDAKLMAKANLADSMGIDSATFMQLAKVAQAAAAKTGQSFEYMFDSIITGTARESRLILDNLGIIVSVEQANKRYAESIGKKVEALTDEEQKLAFLNEVSRQSVGMVSEMSSVNTSLTATIEQTTAAFSNLVDGFQKGLALDFSSDDAGSFFLDLTEAINGTTNALAEAMSKFGTFETMGMMAGNIIISPLRALAELMGKSTDDIFSGALSDKTTAEANAYADKRMQVVDAARPVIDEFGKNWKDVVNRVVAGHTDTVEGMTAAMRSNIEMLIELDRDLKLYNFKGVELTSTAPLLSGLSKDKKKKAGRKAEIDPLGVYHDRATKLLREMDASESFQKLDKEFGAVGDRIDVFTDDVGDFSDAVGEEIAAREKENEAIRDMADKIVKFDKEIEDKKKRAAEALAKETEKRLKEVAQHLTSAIQQIGDWAANMVSAFGGMFTDVFASLANGQGFIGEAVNKLTSMLAGTISMVGAGLNQLAQYIGAAFGPYGQLIGTIVGSLIAAASTVGTAIVSSVGTGVGAGVSAFESGSGTDAVKNKDGQVITQAQIGMKQLLETFSFGFKEIIGELTTAIGADTFKTAIDMTARALAILRDAIRGLDPATLQNLRTAFLDLFRVIAEILTQRSTLNAIVGSLVFAFKAVGSALWLFNQAVGNIRVVLAVLAAAIFTPITVFLDAIGVLSQVIFNAGLLIRSAFLNMVLGVEGLLDKLGLGFMNRREERRMQSDADWAWDAAMAGVSGAVTNGATAALYAALEQLVNTDSLDYGQDPTINSPEEENTDAVKENTEAVKDLAREFRNLPSGYKVARAMYGAEAPRSPSGPTSIYDANDNDVATARTQAPRMQPRNTQQYRF